MQRYWLPGHVYVRILRDIVWFDEKANKYLTIDGAASPILAQSVHGWPLLENTLTTVQITHEQRESLVGRLVARGLLSEQLGDGKRYSSPSDQTPKDGTAFDGRLRNPTIHWHHVARIAVAFVWAAVAFYMLGLQFAIASVERSKANCSNCAPVDLHTVSELVSAFRLLRLFFYSPKDRCLFDSLVLAFYLCGYGIAPTMVFGVAVRPFRSHCWDEWGGFVLNGGSEIAGRHWRIRQI